MEKFPRRGVRRVDFFFLFFFLTKELGWKTYLGKVWGLGKVKFAVIERLACRKFAQV